MKSPPGEPSEIPATCEPSTTRCGRARAHSPAPPMPNFLALRASPWSDPVRKLLTLESFSRTEEDAGIDIALARKSVQDPAIAAHFERHARDEFKHAQLFRARAAELRAEGVAAPRQSQAEKTYDLELTRGVSGANAHGFLRGSDYEEQGELAYVAMLHVAELRAEVLFERHMRALGDDERTRAIFKEILLDERYHVAYTRTLLTRWERAGRGAEVKRALSSARGASFLGAWKRLGAHSATGFARVLLVLSYCTWVFPFGLLARNTRPRTGWRQPPAAGDAALDLRAQY